MSHDREVAATIDEITDNGERVIHLQQHEGFYDHLSIYRFASQFCQDPQCLTQAPEQGMERRTWPTSKLRYYSSRR